MSTQTSLDLFTLAGVCLLGAMTPGPSVVVILGVAARSGLRAAILASWTHALGVALWASLTLYGWRLIVTHTPWAAHTISLIGATYLIYLAYHMWSEAARNQPQPNPEHTSGFTSPASPAASPAHPLEHHSQAHLSRDGLAGLMIAISNPKLILFFTAIYTQILPLNPSPSDQVLALMTPTLIDGTWYSFAVIVASRFGLLSFLERHKVKTLYVTSALLVMISIHTLRDYLGL